MSGGTTVAGTAHWIAAVRARGSSRPDALFRDPQAEALSGEQGFAVMARSEQAAGGENAFIPVRVRWFDDGAEDPAALLAAGGWDADVILVPGAPPANYGRLPPRAAGIRPGETHLVRARR